MPASTTATPERVKDVNTRYHDAAATAYDAKWGIDFGPIGQDQVAAKLRKALGGRPPAPFANALEIGAGTGYFSLNLVQIGLIGRPTATDISAGMLCTLNATAAELGVQVTTVRAEAEELPFDDASFDLVFGHAVLHHIPGLERAFAEFRRVLRPGGTIAFCGEPSRNGDRLAALPKRGGAVLGPLWRRLLGASAASAEPTANGDGDELEPEVDVHAFAPAELRRLLPDAGFEDVRVSGEELVANAYGWLLRSLESSAAADEVPIAWRRFAFRSYLALQRLDTALLEPRLPAELFYNLVLSARKPL
jgi:ubiquinone/menaquinone biosynthesis C-methylase UbiE